MSAQRLQDGADDAPTGHASRIDIPGGWKPVPNDLLDPEHPLHPSSAGEPACRGFAFVDLLGLLRDRPAAGLDRGETRASTRFLAQRWRWSKSKVHRFLAELEEAGVIEREKDAPQRPPRIRVPDRSASGLGQGRGTGSGPEPPGTSEDRGTGVWDTLGVGHEPGHEPGQGRGTGSGPEPPDISEDRGTGSWDTNRDTYRDKGKKEKKKDSSVGSTPYGRETDGPRVRAGPEGESPRRDDGTSEGDDGWACPGCGERVPRTERVAHLRTCADADTSPGERPPSRARPAPDGLPDPAAVVEVEGGGLHTPRFAAPTPDGGT